MKCVAFIHHQYVKASLLQHEQLSSIFSGNLHDFSLFLQQHSITHLYVAGDAPELWRNSHPYFQMTSLQIEWIDLQKYAVCLQADYPRATACEKIATIYGALYHFPSNPCIVVTIDEGIAADLITPAGLLIGALQCPFSTPMVAARHSQSIPTAEKEQFNTGTYYGLLGAIERMVAELKSVAPSPSSVMTLATGTLTLHEGLHTDLTEFIDCVNPHLRFVGLKEIMKERK